MALFKILFFYLLTILLPLMVFAAEEVPNEPTAVQPLLPGSPAPAVSLQRADGSTYELNPQQLDKPIVLVFYRGGWCPYCNLHLAELRNAEKALLDLGYDMVFISPDRPEVLYPSLQEKDINYLLLSDSKMEAAKALGVAFRLDEATLSKYRKHGVDLESASGQQHHMLPVPAVFIIGTDGVIRFQYVNPDYKVRLHNEVLLAAAKWALEGS